MRNAIALLAGIISFASAFPYIIDTAKGKTHPNVVTWFTWTLLNLINSIVAISSGAVQTAIFTGFSGLATGTITVMGLKRGVKHYTPFDYACQGIALLGIVLWRLTDNPSLAIGVALAVNITGALPTLRHAWIAPFAETWQGFAIGGFAAALSVVTIASYNFVSLAFPVWIGINCLLMVGIILGRRRNHPHLAKSTA